MSPRAAASASAFARMYCSASPNSVKDLNAAVGTPARCICTTSAVWLLSFGGRVIEPACTDAGIAWAVCADVRRSRAPQPGRGAGDRPGRLGRRGQGCTRHERHEQRDAEQHDEQVDEPPQELNSAARVSGDPLKPAERLALEQADVPLKPERDSNN